MCQTGTQSRSGAYYIYRRESSSARFAATHAAVLSQVYRHEWHIHCADQKEDRVRINHIVHIYIEHCLLSVVSVQCLKHCGKAVVLGLLLLGLGLQFARVQHLLGVFDDVARLLAITSQLDLPS